jgi:hypothetical protein
MVIPFTLETRKSDDAMFGTDMTFIWSRVYFLMTWIFLAKGPKASCAKGTMIVSPASSVIFNSDFAKSLCPGYKAT